ncbi:hypothetical protein JX265_010905 [Neoarthrinium moseri]|uniref:Uncharacterized protein n=1 Tax=Neoarthrinium moseri TaxID=1658444 RepID=A0A9P9WDN8_9PEZI|nr:uncharacterized protein JN550_008984 [Neoarthrinium moseri]KAI1846321.1 hypothetical protein JX266_007526 [Neoarthrinium moseri]KAI1858237.1 hypothetical protein JX265_010905 [Neoarthrinium moseri]KAI1864427.1 hypothetical protein JN550_008984 [Neoarthrinium moseri]
MGTLRSCGSWIRTDTSPGRDSRPDRDPHSYSAGTLGRPASCGSQLVAEESCFSALFWSRPANHRLPGQSSVNYTTAYPPWDPMARTRGPPEPSSRELAPGWLSRFSSYTPPYADRTEEKGAATTSKHTPLPPGLLYETDLHAAGLGPECWTLIAAFVA